MNRSVRNVIIYLICMPIFSVGYGLVDSAIHGTNFDMRNTINYIKSSFLS